MEGELIGWAHFMSEAILNPPPWKERKKKKEKERKRKKKEEKKESNKAERANVVIFVATIN
jgi:hypothetical protein